jgi:hypothetical protein
MRTYANRRLYFVRTGNKILELTELICSTRVAPTRVDVLDDLVGELKLRNIELKVMNRLTPLTNVWQTTLHASGIRLRNAQGWGKPGWTPSKSGRLVASSKAVSH